MARKNTPANSNTNGTTVVAAPPVLEREESLPAQQGEVKLEPREAYVPPIDIQSVMKNNPPVAIHGAPVLPLTNEDEIQWFGRCNSAGRLMGKNPDDMFSSFTAFTTVLYGGQESLTKEEKESAKTLHGSYKVAYHRGGLMPKVTMRGVDVTSQVQKHKKTFTKLDSQGLPTKVRETITVENNITVEELQAIAQNASARANALIEFAKLGNKRS